MDKKPLTEIEKLRLKQSEFQLKFPELFRSDVSIYPSYGNLKLPYQVVCRDRNDAYKLAKALRQQVELYELSMHQLRAWDGVRLARIFDLEQRAPNRQLRVGVVDPLTAGERQRLYKIIMTSIPSY